MRLSRHNPEVLFDWPTWPGIFAAGPEVVQVVRVALDTDAGTVAAARRHLSEIECRRADRYKFPHLGDRFTICRSVLRQLLGEITSQPPHEVRLKTRPGGKPVFADDETLDFSVSHSADLALIAVSRRPVGVDLEHSARTIDSLRLARRYFAPSEVEVIEAQQTEQAQHAAFFRCWVRKEAYIKAIGVGLAYPLHAFCVPIREEDPPKLLAHDQDEAECARWAIEDVSPSPEFAAALFADGTGWTMHRSAWNHERTCDVS